MLSGAGLLPALAFARGVILMVYFRLLAAALLLAFMTAAVTPIAAITSGPAMAQDYPPGPQQEDPDDP